MPPIQVPHFILNLDLCTLSYQLYHQSLTLPLDPWFDITARSGTDRRTNVCTFTHEYAKLLGAPGAPSTNPRKGFYSGPAAARGWAGGNLTLDPILTNYKQINPKLPMITRDGAKFLAAQAPGYVVDGMRLVEGARYVGKPTNFPAGNTEIFPICDYPGGDDHLVVFEGGTGVVGQSEPAWSLMGYVLWRKTTTGFDVHIVFRGSRSGAALGRTVLQAQSVIGQARGNADWVTDLGGTEQMGSPLLSRVGTMTKGFALAMPTMLGTIKAACKRIAQVNGAAPQNIFVTGHSLGAALASQFASAALIGSFGDQLRQELPAWPWQTTHLVAYAQPIPGNPLWSYTYNIYGSSDSIWVKGDAVVEATSKRIVKWVTDVGEHCGAQVQLKKIEGCSDNVHETFVIRGALVRDASAVRAMPPEVAGITPWAAYDTFSKMLAGQPSSYVYPGAAAPNIVTERNLRSVLLGCGIGLEFERWLEEVYIKMITDKSSYRGPHLQGTLDQRKLAVVQAIARMKVLAPSTNHQEALKNLTADLEIIKGELGTESEEEFICLAMILNYYQKTTLTLTELNLVPSIRKILESRLNQA